MTNFERFLDLRQKYEAMKKAENEFEICLHMIYVDFKVDVKGETRKANIPIWKTIDNIIQINWGLE